MSNYADIEDKYSDLENSEVVLIPVPYDGTSTWVKGADEGPDAFLDASRNMELYDIETDSEVYKKGIHLVPSLPRYYRFPEHMVEDVEKIVTKYLDINKFVTIFGGEHSVSIGTIRAFKKKYNDLTVLQLDAHADLRSSYQGSTCNHACALYEASKTSNLIQVGIRSMDVTEKRNIKKNNLFLAETIMENDLWIDKSISRMGDNVFITLDLDVFDPSIMSSTGTPEPGGMNWYQVLRFLNKVFTKKNVVGFDIMELCPNKENKAPNMLAAKLYYKMLTYKFELNG